MSKIKVICIGYGFLGKWHAQKLYSLHQNVELTAIVEVDKTKHEQLKRDFAGVLISDSFEFAMDKTNSHAVFIVSPTSTHLNNVKTALKMGLHIFCEKPLFENWSDYTALASEINSGKSVVQVGHIERFQHVWSLLNEKGYEKFIANAQLMKAARQSVFKGRAVDVHAEIDQMIHDIDLLLWLWKPKEISVQAEAISGVQTAKRDYVHVTLDCGLGRLAVLECGRLFQKETRKVEFIGKEGALEIDLLNRKVNFVGADGKQDSFDYPQVDQILEEQKAFFKAIRENSIPKVGFIDALESHRVLNDIATSIDRA